MRITEYGAIVHDVDDWIPARRERWCGCVQGHGPDCPVINHPDEDDE